MKIVNETCCTALPVSTPEERITKALAIAVAYGGIDGAHHKDWVIDQISRALTGCPVVKVTAQDCNGADYAYLAQGESPEYQTLVAEACAGSDGPNSYSWDVGIPP